MLTLHRRSSTQLGVTPRGSIMGAGVRKVQLYKPTAMTRIGVSFHHYQKEGLADAGPTGETPRNGDTELVALPIIRVSPRSTRLDCSNPMVKGRFQIDRRGRCELAPL